ncbi:MAG TPA: DUF4249 domain-containing protein [Flavilitoribacter sp.]|nr:DUF4249 domain-containing protein [Flavilitoribacter sp.]HMQ87866.1 DUF4249 domain-containing protein [Flavilitoribacter sp.]
MKNALLFLPIALAVMLAGCNLEKEVDIKLPETQERIVVECYLEPGAPINLLLTRSSGYFDPIPEDNLAFLNQTLVNGATVVIRSETGESYTLDNNLVFNQFTKKIFNYSSHLVAPIERGKTYSLEITLENGDLITASTSILPVVPIDSVVVEFNDTDTLARVLTYLTDRPNEDNYYRRMIQHSSLDTIPDQDFTTDDRFVEDVIVFGTPYDYGRGDTVINTIFHIEKAYFDFLESVQLAIASNGNPFAQPSPIISNVQGPNAMGIFTGLSYDRVVSFLPD